MVLETTIQLRHEFFTEKEKVLAQHHELAAFTFLFSTGVEGLRIVNGVGEIIVLPFQGQQIWDAQFHGRTLTMKSMFSEPYPTTDFLNTYGGFFIHCGATAMGVPTEHDTHPPHGELPNARYLDAQLLVGNDDHGAYFGITGAFQYTVGFNHNYIAQPLIKIYENSTKLSVFVEIRNLKKSPMEFMYLAHVNFRPVDHGRLLYSAHSTTDHVRVRKSVPSHIHPKEGYREFLNSLSQAPDKHHLLEPDLMFDPEVVFFIDYLADKDGWSHSMQLHPDGTADFIRHRPSELDHGIRWISRTPDQDCLGIVLPATAEPEGYTTEKAKGNIKILEPGGLFRTEIQVGFLALDEAKVAADHISDLLA
jgi:hypothetical protein